MGLSGSGKTTLAEQLCDLLNAEHLNADNLREEHNDWDFSQEGRLRQARRIRDLAEQSSNKYVVMDFICPLEESMNIVNADYVIWMDTIKSSRFNDTDQVFVPPKKSHIVTDFNYNVHNLVKKLPSGAFNV